jgi:sulfate/thiosulfate transport system substrate-binding protein
MLRRLFILWAGFAIALHAAEEPRLLNVSFDLSRELFGQVNEAFVPWYRERSGRVLKVAQSHGGSSKQARSVVDGVDADVVTMNTVSDIDFIARRGRLLSTNWRTLHPHNSAPYSSVMVFLVRPGNPQGIRDWGDLVKPGVKIVLPNPKTSGNGRNAYLGAWAHAVKQCRGGETAATEFMRELYARAPVLDTGGRGATISFIQRQIGDVLVTLEAESRVLAREYPEAKFETIYPSRTIEVEMPVAVVDRIASKHRLTEAAGAYVDFLYSREGQEIIARNHFRPRLATAAAASPTPFPEVELVRVDEDLGGWDFVMRRHFGEGGVFDQLYTRRKN